MLVIVLEKAIWLHEVEMKARNRSMDAKKDNTKGDKELSMEDRLKSRRC